MSPQWADFVLRDIYNREVQLNSENFVIGGGFACTCPPTSHTVKLIFLYSTVSTLNPVAYQ